MPYLLIALVVLVALSPLISMMPSRRQRRLANLRQAAASAGLYVQFDNAGAARSESPGVLYGCRRQRGDAPAQPAVYRREAAGWQADSGHWSQQRLEMLDSLPGGVSEIRDEPAGIAVLWDETGERNDVELIARVLRGLLGRKY